MKKKIVALLLTSTLAVCGCSSTSNTSSASTETEVSIATTSETEDSSSDLETLGDIEVDKKIFNVVITIPADYVGETTQEELDKSAEENGYKSITLNDDGSATYVMTKKQHKEMMEGINDSIHQSLIEMIGSEDYPNFTDIQANDDFTEFTITTTSTELSFTETFSTMVFYMYGGMYAIFNGTTVDNVHVDFVNADSGEIISSSDSSDLENVELSTE